jgi:hypothetical protein
LRSAAWNLTLCILSHIPEPDAQKSAAASVH